MITFYRGHFTKKGKKAYKLLKDFMANGIKKDLGCLEACSYMSIKVTETGKRKPDVENRGELILSFLQKIHRSVSYYLYEEISLIAEIGGFVGLFLGASVYQIADLLDSLMTRISKFFKWQK